MATPERLANRDLDVASVLPAAPMPDQARVVIVGGGIIGSSIAYHLTRAGERDVVHLARGRSGVPGPRVARADRPDPRQRRGLPAPDGGDRGRYGTARDRRADD